MKVWCDNRTLKTESSATSASDSPLRKGGQGGSEIELFLFVFFGTIQIRRTHLAGALRYLGAPNPCLDRFCLVHAPAYSPFIEVSFLKASSPSLPASPHQLSSISLYIGKSNRQCFPARLPQPPPHCRPTFFNHPDGTHSLPPCQPALSNRRSAALSSFPPANRHSPAGAARRSLPSPLPTGTLQPAQRGALFLPPCQPALSNRLAGGMKGG